MAVGESAPPRVSGNMVDRTQQPGPGADAPDWDALARYLAGESDLAEAIEIRRWLDADPARERLFAKLDRALDPALVAPSAEVDVEAALARTRARLDFPEIHSIGVARRARDEREVLTGRRAPPAWRTLVLRAAAVAAILAGPYVVYSLATREPGLAPVAGIAPPQIVATEAARIDSLFLADGTRVILGPGTTLAVHADYGGVTRELTVEGEAMFDVVHDETRPFRVYLGEGVVQDLGTAFSVRTASNGEARVVVTEGSVRLRREAEADETGVILYEGDRGLLSRTGAPVAERGTATDEDTAWTRGVLSLREATVSEIDSELRRWYGYHFSVSGSDLAERRLTASFEGESAGQVGEVIALAFGGRSEVRGDTIVIHPVGLP